MSKKKNTRSTHTYLAPPAPPPLSGSAMSVDATSMPVPVLAGPCSTSSSSCASSATASPRASPIPIPRRLHPGHSPHPPAVSPPAARARSGGSSTVSLNRPSSTSLSPSAMPALAARSAAGGGAALAVDSRATPPLLGSACSSRGPVPRLSPTPPLPSASASLSQSSPVGARENPFGARAGREARSGGDSGRSLLLLPAVADAIAVLPETHPAAQMARRASASGAECVLEDTGHAITAWSAAVPPRRKRVSWRDGDAGCKLCASLPFAAGDAPRACSRDAEERAKYVSPHVTATQEAAREHQGT